jgi:glycosyltransferase involved in cell wall biosynthesis
MHIALIVPGGVDRSGVQRVIPVLLGLIDTLALRHRVTVISLAPEPVPSTYTLCGAQVYALGRARLGTQLGRTIALLRNDPPDVLHAFWLGATSTLAWLVGRMLGRPSVASLGGGELVHIAEIGYGGNHEFRSRVHSELAIRFAAALTAGSHYALAPLQRRRPAARWLPLGVVRRDVACCVPANHAQHKQLLHVASLNRVKDQPTLLRAVALAAARLAPQRVVLDIVGEDTLGGAIHREAQRLGLAETVRFHGFLPNNCVRTMLDAADLYLLSSRHESQCVAVLEAALAGVPTVGTAVGLLPELAPSAAWAVPIGDAAALAEGIVALLNDEQRRQALGSAARQWAMAHDAAWTGQQFEAIYEAVGYNRY